MTDLVDIRNKILTEMYAEAEPSLDFEQVLDDPERFDDDWYENHYLHGDKQRSIFDKHVSDYDLTDREYESLLIECIMHLGPTTVPPQKIEA